MEFRAFCCCCKEGTGFKEVLAAADAMLDPEAGLEAAGAEGWPLFDREAYDDDGVRSGGEGLPA